MPEKDFEKALQWELKERYGFNPAEQWSAWEEAFQSDHADGSHERLINVYAAAQKAVQEKMELVR